ncbi:MFS transporter [Streptomyces sp. SID12488]|uniref:MFS transporter n=1 Tax=Streptomyces sp. SID12488 TaxID=2706040 RepID=UPI0013D9CD27|nr:MFS transporter [Streptomyces sp. SID12488]NEA64578.1 MFS transporter [Streptomyces sp. SID12488]
MRSYSALFRTPEFTPLFLSTALRSAASTIGGLALATLTYRATGSPLLSALSMFGPQLAQVVGATTLLSASDRLPPRATLTGIALAFALGTAVMATPGLPIGAVFAVLFVLGLIASLGAGVGWGLLNEILVKEGYLLGRSVFNMSNGLMQIAGFATGGVMVATLSPRTTLLTSAALYLAGALMTRLGLTRRPPRLSGRPSIAQTWRTNAELWSARPRRLTYLGLWIPNGLVVGIESLYVSYDPGSAGTLFACAALGMLIGDVTIGRFVSPRLRRRLAVPLLLLLAAPNLVFALGPGVWAAAVTVCVASVGYGASLVQQERLMSLTPPELSGHALGLHSAGMLTMQGVSAALAGTIAQLTSPGAAMTVMAAGSVCVTVGLVAAGRREGRGRGESEGALSSPAERSRSGT